jgi:hypothetical protein
VIAAALAVIGTVAWTRAGESVQGRPIEVMTIGSGAAPVLIIGGIHGDEPEGMASVERFAAELAADPSIAAVPVVIVRNLNPDGAAASTRGNAHGVDLNRNFPAADWSQEGRGGKYDPGEKPASEPETQALLALLKKWPPSRILVMHATKGKALLNYDGPGGQALAEALAKINGYEPSPTIGYPTPGSLGNYGGLDLKIPVITFEIPRGTKAKRAWTDSHDVLRAFVR